MLGSGLAVASAVCFGTGPIFGKLAYRAGLGLPQLLVWRFLLAAVVLTALAFAFGQPFWRLGRRRAAFLISLGLIAYAGQTFTFFTALQTLSASFVELVLYAYPALVAIAAWALYRRRIARLELAALAITFLGIAVLIGGRYSAAGWGLVFAVASPCIYTVYIVAAERLMVGSPSLAACALIMAGAGITATVIAAISGHLSAPESMAARASVAGFAAIPTVAAVTLFLAALPLIGAPRVALLSTLEPVVTVVLAIILLGDHITLSQGIGSFLVLVAVVVLQVGLRAPEPPAFR